MVVRERRQYAMGAGRRMTRGRSAASAGGGGGGATLPTADLIARLTAKTGVTTGATFGWADQVGSFDAVQSVALDQPTYTPGVSVDFDGSNHWLDWTGLTTSTAWTVVFAVDLTADGSTRRYLNTSNSIDFVARQSGSTRLRVGGSSLSVAAADGPQIITFQCDNVAGRAYVWRDGVDLTGGGFAVTPRVITGTIGLFAWSTGATTFRGSAYEVLVYDAAIDAAQRAAARAWLQSEHGI